MRTRLTLALVLVSTATAVAAPPRVLAPDVISGPAADAAPAFTPDGNTVFFTRGNNASFAILVSQRRGATWSAPTIASFSGTWSDMEPAMAPDGAFLVFVSNRPARPGGAVLDGRWNGATFPGNGGNLWRVDRKGDGWSEPVRLPDVINRGASIFAPSIARDGSVYFMEPAADTGRFHIFRSQRAGGGYQAPVAVSFTDLGAKDGDPAVAPDESYAVFASTRAPSLGGMDLFFVRKRADGQWGAPVHLGAEVNSAGSDAEPRLSPDGRTLYFASDRTVPVAFPRPREAATRDLARMSWDNGLYNIWQVDLGPWLDAKR
jgi:Tol biopolymer transport system component